ncbi:MAG: Ig-like domain-containing protein [Prevotella sp.]|nr:Ig-like domain-containing protein [Prevotella sp.]
MKYKLLRFSLLSVLVMLCGTMVAADKWVKTDPASLTTGDVVAIVDQTSATAMSNDKGTSAAPVATAVTLNDDKSEITGEVAENLQWVVTASEGSYKFGVSGTENYLYCTNTNNGVHVGTNENNSFKWIADAENTNSTESFLVNEATTRYVGVYNNTDWRCYTSINNNIKGTVTAFYKKTAGEPSNKTATTVTLAEGYATTGLVGGTIALPTATVKAGDNTIEAATVTWASSNEEVAKIEGSNISLLKAGTAKITASYAGDDTNEASSASFTVTVTGVYTSLKALQEAVTSTSTPAKITFNNVFVTAVKGDNAYLADSEGYGVLLYTKNHGLEAGQVLNGTITANIILYRGQTEITDFSKEGLTITTTELTPTEKTIDKITAANQSTLVTLKGVTYKDGKLSDGTNEITFYNTFSIADESLPVADKTYDITGIIILYNTTIEIAPRTAADIVEAAAEEGYVYRDFAVNLTNADAIPTTSNSFGVKVAEDGTYTAVAADDATANFTVKAVRFNDAQHGWVNCVFTIPVQGPVLIKLGDCQFGDQTGTITDTEGNVTALTEPAKQCWAAGNPDQNVVATYYRGLSATTLTVTYEGYCPFISVKAIDPADLPAEVVKHTVTFAAGEATGEVPAAIEDEVGAKITLPTNFTLYVEGKTLTAWSDGENTFAPGAEYTIPEADATLTAVFTENEVSLADRTEAVTVKWNFRRDQGAPAVGWEGKTGLVWVGQATVNGKTIDVALPFSTSPGKFNNKNNTDWVQINNGTKFTVPSCKGAVVSLEGYNILGEPAKDGQTVFLTIDGQNDYTHAKTVSYTIANTAENIDVVIGEEGSYYRYIQVVLPVVASAGGEKYENADLAVEWPMLVEGNVDLNTNTATPAAAVSVASFEYTPADATVATGSRSKDPENGLKFVTFTGANVQAHWFVKPATGLTFTPTQIKLFVQRFGTNKKDGVVVTAKVGDNGEATTLGTFTARRANWDDAQEEGQWKAVLSNLVNEVVIDLTEAQQAALASGEGFHLYATTGLASDKAGGFADCRIYGKVNGTKADIASYTLATVVAPEEAGSINVYPKADSYEAGSEVKLTATENFGYDFVNWTDATGTVVSEEPVYTHTMTADETLTANFKKVETYELKLTVDGTNDYMVTVNPAPTVVDGKNMYEAGTAVQLTANQYEGLVTFTNWSDGETNSSKLISMDEDIEITASYSEADIIAGWDFYKTGGNGRKADFYAQDNDADALNLVNTETGETQGWLDKSTVGAGGYESFKGAAVNWRTGASNGDVGNWHWQTKVNAEAFTDINVQFQMMYNYNAYQTYNAEYSLDGENWTKFGSITMSGAKAPASFSEKLPEAANNQKDLYIRMIADKTSNVDGASSANDGNTLAMFFITGTPKLVDDPVAPALTSSVPAEGATGASASGKIVLNFDKKVQVVEGTKAKLGALELTPAVSGKVITFDYKGLEYSTQYTFTLPANTVKNLTGATLAEAITINFTTMTRPTVTKGLYDAVVENVDQLLEAIAAAQSRSDKNVRYRIFVKNGEYTIPLSSTMKTVNGYEVPECITFINTQNLSLIGESRDGVIITNGIEKSATFAGTYGTTSKYDGIGNSDVFQISGSDYYFQDLTIETGMDDATGRDLAVQDKATRTIYKNTGLRGYQDTWTSSNDNGLYYFEGGYVRGRTDYMCGKGDAFFSGVELRQIAGGYAAVPSKPAKYGWVYKDCVINGEDAVVNAATGEKRTAAQADGNYTLGRPWGSGTPIALFIDTKMNVVPSSIGWNEMSNGWPARFAEYNSTTSTGSVIDLSGRKKIFADTHENNPVLTAEEALENSNLHRMFGDWDPTLATEQAPIPTNVKQEGNNLTWDDSNYALLWAVTKDGAVIGFTTEPTFELPEDGTYAVRAANEMGGLSEASAPVTASGVTTGITTVETEQPVITDDAIYTIQGVRVDKARKGLYIIGGRKVVIK